MHWLDRLCTHNRHIASRLEGTLATHPSGEPIYDVLHPVAPYLAAVAEQDLRGFYTSEVLLQDAILMEQRHANTGFSEDTIIYFT